MTSLVVDLRGGGRGRIALRWFQCLLDAVVHPSDVARCCSRLNCLTELIPVLVGAAPGGVLDLVPGSPEHLQVPLGGSPLVLSECGALGLNNGRHLGRLASNQSCDFEVFFPKEARAVRWMVSRRASASLWQYLRAVKHCVLSQMPLRTVPLDLTDVNTWGPQFLSAVKLFGLQPDLATY